MTFPDIDTIDSYGGVLNDAEPVTDPTTDRSAVGMNTGLASTAAMTATAMIAWCRFVGNASTPTLAASNGSGAAWGNDPGVRPTISHIGTGHYRATWPVTVTDVLGTTHTLNLKRGLANVEGSTLSWALVGSQVANTIDIFTFNAAGSANDLAGQTIHLQVG